MRQAESSTALKSACLRFALASTAKLQRKLSKTASAILHSRATSLHPYSVAITKLLQIDCGSTTDEQRNYNRSSGFELQDRKSCRKYKRTASELDRHPLEALQIGALKEVYKAEIRRSGGLCRGLRRTLGRINYFNRRIARHITPKRAEARWGCCSSMTGQTAHKYQA